MDHGVGGDQLVGAVMQNSVILCRYIIFIFITKL